MTGFRTTIYLSDELGEVVRALDMNVSAICQAALRAEIARRTEELEAAVVAGRNAEKILALLNGSNGGQWADLQSETEAIDGDQVA